MSRKTLIYLSEYGKDKFWGRIENNMIYKSEYGNQDFLYRIVTDKWGKTYVYRGITGKDLVYRVEGDYIYKGITGKDLAFKKRGNYIYSKEFGNDSFVCRLEEV